MCSEGSGVELATALAVACDVGAGTGLPEQADPVNAKSTGQIRLRRRLIVHSLLSRRRQVGAPLTN
jgi:hypothetical protein